MTSTGVSVSPLFFLQDNEGNILFDSTDNVSCEVLKEFRDDDSGKNYPSEIKYRFEKDGKVLDYHLQMRETIENMGIKGMGFGRRMVVKLLKMTLSYARFEGIGTMDYSEKSETVHRENNLIYEFMYPGTEYKGYM